MWPTAADSLPICLSALFAAILAFELVGPQTPSEASSRFGRMGPAPSFSVAAPPDASATLQRPLFTPTRRPFGPGAASAGPQRLEDFRLVGSIRSRAGTLAVLTLADGTMTTIRPGSTLLGWRVESVTAEGVRLRSGDSTRLLTAAGGQAPASVQVRASP
jgi:hypothetical protein